MRAVKSSMAFVVGAGAPCFRYLGMSVISRHACTAPMPRKSGPHRQKPARKLNMVLLKVVSGALRSVIPSPVFSSRVHVLCV